MRLRIWITVAMGVFANVLLAICLWNAIGSGRASFLLIPIPPYGTFLFHLGYLSYFGDERDGRVLRTSGCPSECLRDIAPSPPAPLPTPTARERGVAGCPGASALGAALEGRIAGRLRSRFYSVGVRPARSPLRPRTARSTPPRRRMPSTRPEPRCDIISM